MESIVPSRAGFALTLTDGAAPSESRTNPATTTPPALRLVQIDAKPGEPPTGPAPGPEPDPGEPLQEPIDLRRRRTRDYAEFMLRRSEWLSARDRAIVVAIYEHGETAAAVARLCNTRADLLRYHLRVLARRMQSPEFAMVASCRRQWPPKLRKVATACFLHGLTMREAALQLRMTLHEVRCNRDVVRMMVEEWEARVRARPLAAELGKGG